MICPYCHTNAMWTENKRIYGKNYGKSYMCWWCPVCKAYVGCHNNTRQPLGTMANKMLRDWRITAHSFFDPLWKKGKINRKELYKKISKDLGKQIHIAWADTKDCGKIIEWCRCKHL